MSSDCDFSDSSGMSSPPIYHSPSQQVPQIANILSELTCDDIQLLSGNKPFLRIIEQPQNHFRFRYVSEMVGTHGCILGKSCTTNKTKIHPTVELVNYTEQALIRCCLVQHNNGEEHPHKLLEDEQDRDVSYKVPEQGSYRVGFAGMGIIHTAKKDVPALLFKKYAESHRNFNVKEIRAQCENKAKTMNLNIVRLKFSAHDIHTGNEICAPVFSEPIHNMKSAATNDLKICRISRCSGRPRGSDDVFIFVEKVNKKNIMIRFYEINETGDVIWAENAKFLQSDVHHQYGIVFRTPAYKNIQISNEVKVYIELVRPSDGRTSDPKEFYYRPEPMYKQNKKRKANSSYSSLESGGSINSLSELPTPVAFAHKRDQCEDEKMMYEISTVQALPVVQGSPLGNVCGLGEALIDQASGSSMEEKIALNPMLAQIEVSGSHLSDLRINSEELKQLLPADQQFVEADWSEYLKSYNDSHLEEMSSMDIVRPFLIADSGRQKPVSRPSTTNKVSTDATKETCEYAAYYKTEEGIEVKKIVKELCDLIRSKRGFKKQDVRDKLDRLFDMRLSNGDTFLHMTLCSNQPSFEYIVKLINSMKMTRLLNLVNYYDQTILHLAVLNDMPQHVSLLVGKGCNPMLKDQEGNNVVHCAVVKQSCLQPLLDAIKTHNVPCDLNDCNSDNQTALHLAVICDSAESVAALLRAGAASSARDAAGRTALHLAAYDLHLRALPPLLHAMSDSDIDITDGCGNTALQIACGGSLTENTYEIVKLLLDKKADPMKHEDHNETAWKLSKDKPEIRELIKKYIKIDIMYEDDVKSEPEDDFESADEGDQQEVVLNEMSLYIHEVASLVDRNGSWRELARCVHQDSLLSWFGSQPSPTQSLLLHLKECQENITSKSLALILDNMGQRDAAKIIRQYIE